VFLATRSRFRVRSASRSFSVDIRGLPAAARRRLVARSARPISFRGEETDARAAGRGWSAFSFSISQADSAGAAFDPFIGIYHAVEKTQDTYRLATSVAWRIAHGDQEFLAQPGTRYMCSSAFLAHSFLRQVQLRWYLKDEARVDLAGHDPIKISAARGGLRGYGFKTNYQPGSGRCRSKPPTDARSQGVFQPRDATEWRAASNRYRVAAAPARPLNRPPPDARTTASMC